MDINRGASAEDIIINHIQKNRSISIGKQKMQLAVSLALLGVTSTAIHAS